MSFFRQFDAFDPLDGEVPYVPFFDLNDIARRARRILVNRSRENVIAAAENIDWMIDGFFEDQPTTYGRTSRADYSDVNSLEQCIWGYTLADDKEFPDGREAEYFAVLGLWKLGDAIERLLKITAVASMASAGSSDRRPIDRELACAVAGQYALEAMDAVGRAERLSEVESLTVEVAQLRAEANQSAAAIEQRVTEETNKKISLNAQKAAIKRHTENHSMKNQVFAWYEAHRNEFRSMERAAQAVAGKLVPVAVRTARDWISEWENMHSARKP